MKIKHRFIIALLATSFAGMASATPMQGMNVQYVKGQALDFDLSDFKKRIDQGVNTGELTRKEETNLRQGLRELRQEVRAAKSDNRISKREKRQLERQADRLSKEIHRKRHNDRKRRM